MNEPQMYAQGEASLSAAWARAFLKMREPPERELAPFLVSIAAGPDGLPVEDASLRNALDACLEETGNQTVDKVAKSIFPHPLWRRAKGDRRKLYTDYLENLPDYVAMEAVKNRYGLYFARLIGYGVNHKTGEAEAHLKGKLKVDGNQLEYIINACKPKAQRMALQASIYDPARDQSEARRPFPCLQHIAFVPDFGRGTLTLNAFYALQLLFVKAYGNWLGLFRLGAFVASQTTPRLRFARLCCYAGVQKMTAESGPKPGDRLDRLTKIAGKCAGGYPVNGVEAAACRAS
jgi:hypothetical protein